MKFSLNWLREFVDLPPRVEALAELLTLAGVEIEGIEKRGADFENVVVAEIKESKQHPNADRLSICVVDDGTGSPRQIVCGAKNYKVGDKVPLALSGAELLGGLKIKASKLRGVESEGMLCSAKELGIAEDAAGLLILSPDAKIGAPIGTLFPADTIFDVEITPNRGDLLSHFGLAREISALVGASLRDDRGRVGDASLPTLGGVKIFAARECPFYSARRIEHVTVRPSPEWLRTRIESVGIRSINNVVDITNFVMLELGQPLHAFDADKLDGAINVRLATDSEKFLALDGKTYSLRATDLVITDRKRAVAIAGVMGGEETGVTGTTKNVLLESAYFRPESVRKTARELNLPSDSSYHFERGVDPGMTLRASQRAAELIQEIAGGNLAREIDIAGELPGDPPDVRLRPERADKILGVHIEPERVDEILTRYGLQKQVGHVSNLSPPGDGKLETCATWAIPSFRRDLAREEDLIEEIVRVHGIDNIPKTDRSRSTPSSQADRAYDLEAELRQQLIGAGLNEVRSSRLVPRAVLGSGFAERAAELRNALNEDHVALRPSLIPGLLDVVGRNLRAGVSSIALFEVGRVFDPETAVEGQRLAIALTGAPTNTAGWRGEDKRRFDIFDLKGVIDSIAHSCRRDYAKISHPSLALAARITLNAKAAGTLGQLARSLASDLDATSGVFVAEFALDGILAARHSANRFTEMDKFPSVTRDIAMIAPEELTHAEITRVIDLQKEPLLASVALFDLFAGSAANAVGEARKSLAYSLTYRGKNRTLTNDEVNAAHSRIRERLRSDLGVELREQ